MSAPKHTPGPWTLRHDFDDSGAWIVLGDALVVIGDEHGHFAIATIEPSFSNQEELFNAKLIAAAPDLAEALLKVANIWDGAGCYGDITDMINAALTKAGLI